MGEGTSRAARWVAIGIATCLVLLQGTLAVLDGSLAWAQALSNGAIGTVGAVILLRRPELGLGQLMVVAAGAFSVATFYQTPDAIVALGTVSTAVFALSTIGGGVGVSAISAALLFFPDGRIPSPGWRWVPRWMVLYALLVPVVMLTKELPDGARLIHLDVLPGYDYEGVFELVLLPGLVVFFLSLAALVVRFRSGSPTVRRQIGWVMYGVGIYFLFLVVPELGVGSGLGGELALVADAVFFMALPISIGVAIFRYRLFELDRVVNRSLVYLVVVGLLAASYFAFVYFLGTVLPFESDLAVAGSTVGVAALFNPLRRRIQRLVDRRFFRPRFDAVEVLRGFAGRLRGPMTEGRLATELTEVLDSTMHPEALGVWLVGPERSEA